VNIKISYQTLLLPPPFAFGYTLEIDMLDKELKINFEMEYLNRDTITEDEVLEEGFTMNDDFQWKGVLGKAWSDRLIEINSIELEETSSNEHIWMHFRMNDGSTERSGLASDVDTWDFNIQELIQAIYEKTKRELPLSVELIYKSEKSSTKYLVEGHFETLKSTINDQPIDWVKMQDLMEKVFSQDYDDKFTKKPSKQGLWVDLDGTREYYFIENSKSLLDQLTAFG
jgi:hypothetical protein